MLPSRLPPTDYSGKVLWRELPINPEDPPFIVKLKHESNARHRDEFFEKRFPDE
jgi:hypothetical protein